MAIGRDKPTTACVVASRLKPLPQRRRATAPRRTWLSAAISGIKPGPSLRVFAMDYDAFLSHHSADKPLIRELRRRLQAQDLRVWLDEEDLRPGQRWQDGLEAGIRASASVLVCIGGSGIGPWEDEEMQAALDLAAHEKRPVIPVLLPGAPERPAISIFLKSRTWVDLRAGLKDPSGLKRLEWGITQERPARGDPAVTPGEGREPPPNPACGPPTITLGLDCIGDGLRVRALGSTVMPTNTTPLRDLSPGRVAQDPAILVRALFESAFQMKDC